MDGALRVISRDGVAFDPDEPDALWLVRDGEAFTVEDPDAGAEALGLRTEDYGTTWLIIQAESEAEAVEWTRAYVEHRHPAQAQLEQVTAAYHAGAFKFADIFNCLLPGRSLYAEGVVQTLKEYTEQQAEAPLLLQRALATGDLTALKRYLWLGAKATAEEDRFHIGFPDPTREEEWMRTDLLAALVREGQYPAES
jgi:hypothetical protein